MHEYLDLKKGIHTSEAELHLLDKQLSVKPPIVNAEHLGLVTEGFREYFESSGYEHIPSIPITSKVDRSVRFIGAPISVMKPLFLEGNIPDPGAFMVQNCVRTRNAPNLFNIETVPKYGSFFTGLVTLTTYEKLGGLCVQAGEYLTSTLGIKKSDVNVNINEQDRDLANAVQEFGFENVNWDTKPLSYYRHKYGIDGVWGRNFNLGVRSPLDNTFDDIGNIIVIENDSGHLGVELALGDTTILKQMHGLEHIQDSYGIRIAGEEAPASIRRKLEDSVITSLALYSEGLRPGATNNQTRLLRTYLKAISFYRQLLEIDHNDLGDRISEVESGVLPFDATNMAKEIMGWVGSFERGLYETGPMNKEDVTILNTLGGLATVRSLAG